LTWCYTAPVRVVADTLGAIGEVQAFGGVNQNGRLATIRVYVEDVLGLVKRPLWGSVLVSFRVWDTRKRWGDTILTLAVPG